MAAQYYKINYKSDFVLTINSDAGWAVPFCIKFWTGIPSHGYFAGFDGENYVNCRVGETPTQLLVMFDDHHMPIGPLRMQIAYHTTIEEFPDRKFDEVTNPTNVTVDIDGTEYQVMLDFTGETGAEIDFSMPSSGVMSVNGKIGYVTLNAEDVGAQPTIEDLATIRSGAAAGATAVQPDEMTAALATKQDVINDLPTIRSGAAAGATAVQPATLQDGLQTKQDVIEDLSTIRSGAAAGATAVQPAALQEGLAGKQDTISDLSTIRSGAAAGATAVQTDEMTAALAEKQDVIEDLSTIRSGAAAGATAVQPAAMNTALAAKQDTLTFDNAPTANSSNPVKSSGIKTALDAKQSTISTVNVTVDNNTGTPSGSASVSGSTLSLSFQNLKGETGERGLQGETGPRGERGLPGESGVTGDVSGFTVIQTIDPSATYGATDIAGAATVQATNAELTELEGEVGLFGLTFERLWNFSNGDIVENVLIYHGNTGRTLGLFVTPYIDVTDVKSHRWKWYAGTDRSGYSGNIASLLLECFDENKTYFTGYSYYADPRTFTLAAADQTRVKYIRITFVMTGDCYLQDLDTGDYIWYGYYVGKKYTDEAIGAVDTKANTNTAAIGAVDTKANTNTAEISKAENILARVNDFSKGGITDNSFYYNGNILSAQGVFLTDFITVDPTHTFVWYQGTDRSGVSGVAVAGLMLVVFDANGAQIAQYAYNADPRTFNSFSSSVAKVRVSFVANNDCYLFDKTDNKYIWYGYNAGYDKVLKAINDAAELRVKISDYKLFYDRVFNFDIGDVKVGKFLYNNNELSAQGVFLTGYIPVTGGHKVKWYQGTDRSGVSGVAVAGLMLATYTEDFTQTHEYAYNADPRTLTLDADTAYVRISMVLNNDCYLQDITDDNYIYYGFYVGYNKIMKAIDDAVASADISNGMPQSDNFYLTNLIQSKRPHRDVASATSGKILSLLHFSDIHGQATPLQHILAFKDKYSSYIDDILFTGDLMNDHFGQTNIFENVSGAENILFTTGNHDVWLGSAENPYNSVPYSNVSTLQVYNEYIAPFVANWGVVQPTDAATLGLNYYYKDYDNIRLIVLDCFAPNGSTYIADQVSWLSGVLSSARTSSKAVVIAVHQTAAALDYERETGFCSYERTISEFIDSSFVNAVQSFIDAGGEFVCWLAGHTHCDLFGTLANHPNQTQITITCAYHDQYDDGRVVGTPTADSFNVVSFDTYSKLIKVLRVGNNEDRYLRPKNVLTWDYANKRIVSTF